MTRETTHIIRNMSLTEVNELLASAATAPPDLLAAARRRLEQLTGLIAGRIDGIDGRGSGFRSQESAHEFTRMNTDDSCEFVSIRGQSQDISQERITA